MHCLSWTYWILALSYLWTKVQWSSYFSTCLGKCEVIRKEKTKSFYARTVTYISSVQVHLELGNRDWPPGWFEQWQLSFENWTAGFVKYKIYKDPLPASLTFSFSLRRFFLFPFVSENILTCPWEERESRSLFGTIHCPLKLDNLFVCSLVFIYVDILGPVFTFWFSVLTQDLPLWPSSVKWPTQCTLHSIGDISEVSRGPLKQSKEIQSCQKW